jgi:hypothetical protein
VLLGSLHVNPLSRSAVAALSIPFAVTAFGEHLASNNNALLECTLVLLARLAPPLLNLTNSLDHARQPLHTLGLGPFVDTTKVVLVKPSAASNDDWSLNRKVLDRLDPLVPGLNALHGSYISAIRIHDADKEILC